MVAERGENRADLELPGLQVRRVHDLERGDDPHRPLGERHVESDGAAGARPDRPTGDEAHAALAGVESLDREAGIAVGDCRWLPDYRAGKCPAVRIHEL